MPSKDPSSRQSIVKTQSRMFFRLIARCYGYLHLLLLPFSPIYCHVIIMPASLSQIPVSSLARGSFSLVHFVIVADAFCKFVKAFLHLCRCAVDIQPRDLPLSSVHCSYSCVHFDIIAVALSISCTPFVIVVIALLMFMYAFRLRRQLIVHVHSSVSLL